MKIFVDTTDLDEIREAASWGVVDGVTTNPRRGVDLHSCAQFRACFAVLCSRTALCIVGCCALLLRPLLCSLVMKSGKDFRALADDIFKLLPHGEISLEVVATDAEGTGQPAAPRGSTVLLKVIGRLRLARHATAGCKQQPHTATTAGTSR